MYKGKSVHLTTYGVRQHLRPAEQDVAVSCLNIPNPYNQPGDPEDLMLLGPGFPVALGLGLEQILNKLRHTDHAEVGVFCLFGQHRSPVMAKMLSATLQSLGIEVKPTSHLCRGAA
jgi:RNase adaptor protein for sRNA GlmZ degradation